MLRQTTAICALSRRAHPTRGVAVAPSPRNRHTSPASTTETHAAQSRGQGSPTSPPPIDVEAIRSRLRDWGVLASSSLRQRVDQFSKKATTTFSHLGLHLNRVTGYEEIEALKRQVVEQGTVLQPNTISDGDQRISRPRGSNQDYATSSQRGQDRL